MANVFSSAISDGTGQPGSTVKDVVHARQRITLAKFAAAAHPDTDDLVLGYFKSSDQIIGITIFTDGGGTAGAFNLGLWTAKFSNGGTVLAVADADIFASAVATGTAISVGGANTDLFAEAGTLDDFDRGKPIWALLGLSEDNGETYALVAEISTTIDAANELGFNVQYVAGD